MQTIEEWRTIEGFSMYLVSDKGNIKSLHARKGGATMSLAKNSQGYLCIRLKSDSGERKSLRVHRLVALAFIGKSQLDVNHIDGDVSNNISSNLEYVTRRENSNHYRRRHGKPTGAYLQPDSALNPWYSKIKLGEKYIHLGYFKTMEEASAAYRNAVSAAGEEGKYVR